MSHRNGPVNSVTAKFPQSGFCWEYRRWRTGDLQGWKSVLRKSHQIPEVEASPRRAAHLQLGKTRQRGINRSMLLTPKSPQAFIYLSNTCKWAGIGHVVFGQLSSGWDWCLQTSPESSQSLRPKPLMHESPVPTQQRISDTLNCSVSSSTSGFCSHLSSFLAVSHYYNAAKPCEVIITSRHP